MRNNSPVSNAILVILNSIAGTLLCHSLTGASWLGTITFILVWNLIMIGAVVTLARSVGHTTNTRNRQHRQAADHS